ncbi:MAG: T9SS type A sorting domain-containing protein [Bacteroidales bacterium]|nr:T9SS type A sorting domain-containing protein [Bacteroidales bacterium]
MAQYENPMVPQSAIQFWTGTGSNRAVVAITWNDATAGNIGIAWGVQWNGNNVTAGSLMDTIAAYDSRLTVSGNTASWITNFTYVDAELGLNLVGPSGWWWYNWKASDGTPHSSSGVSADIMVNGDFLDWLPMDEETYASYPADTMIMATDPNGASLPEESTIAASEILYWVGEGSNQVVMAVNWADTALAWGYRFNGTKSVSDMLNDIATADPRFSIEIGQYGLDDIVFVVAPGDTLRKQAYSYWESKNNGAMDAGMGQPLNDGDLEKWAEPAAGIVVDSTYWEAYSYWSYTYVYTMDIHPVSVPQTENINDIDAVSINVYPNPASHMVTISGANDNSEAVLYDMLGSTVATYKVNGTESRIDLSNVTNGVYLLRIDGKTVRLVVRH